MTMVNGVDSARLRAFIERIERLEEEKAAIAADIKDVYAEAKGTGYDVKTIRQIIKLRKMEREDREEQEQLLDLYKHALGMLADLPLGEAAIEREISPVRKATRRVQAARSAPAHDPDTGEIKGSSGIMAPDRLPGSAGQPSPGKRQYPLGTDDRGTGYEGSAVTGVPAVALGLTAAGGSPAPIPIVAATHLAGPAPEIPDEPPAYLRDRLAREAQERRAAE